MHSRKEQRRISFDPSKDEKGEKRPPGGKYIRSVESRDFEGLEFALLHDYPDVFSDDLKGRPPIKGANLKINMKEGAVPVKCNTALTTPLHLRKPAKETMTKLLESDIIEKVPANEPSEWCSRGLFVGKHDNSARLVTDMSPVNKNCVRSPKPFPTTKDILNNLDINNKVFARVDCTSGYFQINVDPESRKYTTFIIDTGRYRYKRGPMGLSLTGDAFVEATDQAFADQEGTEKLVDDGITCATDLMQLETRMRGLLEACKEYNIILSRKKFLINHKVPFAGHIVGDSGISPDPEKIKAIKDFPAPTNVSEVRSFMGMVNQLGSFMPDLAQLTEPIQSLVKKNMHFYWGEPQERAFNHVKHLLTDKLICKPFDLTSDNLRTVLYTDASTLGLGYVLIQEEIFKDRVIDNRLIRCGSRILQPAERNYAPTELEALAIHWAANHCDHFLQGAPHVIVRTDHNALIGLWKKELSSVPNKRVMNYRERTQHYNLHLEYIEGKKNCMADALSRAPLTTPKDIAEAAKEIGLEAEDFHHAFSTILKLATYDPRYTNYLDDRDPEYFLLIKAIAGKSKSKAPQLYKDSFDTLSLLGASGSQLVFKDAHRLVIPGPARKRAITALHQSHAGWRRTHQLAQRIMFWPTMANDIKTTIDACHACRKADPRQQRSSPKLGSRDAENMYPMSDVGIDLMNVAGKEYIIMVDRFSGFPFVAKLTHTSTRAIIDKLMTWFSVEGMPRRIRSDGGPQFRGPFEEWCECTGIIHEKSSAYNPESNGLAEAAVKNVKRVLMASMETGEDPNNALVIWRTTPKHDGPSPAALFRHRELRLPGPDLPSQEKSEEFYTTNEMRKFVKQRQSQMDRTLKTVEKKGTHYDPIEEDVRVDVYDTSSGQWLLDFADTVKVRENQKSYVLRAATSGKTIIRNRRYIRPATPPHLVEEKSPMISHLRGLMHFRLQLSPLGPKQFCGLSLLARKRSGFCWVRRNSISLPVLHQR